MIFDEGVLTWLGNSRIVDLTMPVPPISDQVDHNIAVEAVPVFSGEDRHADDGIRVFRVDVENGYL